MGKSYSAGCGSALFSSFRRGVPEDRRRRVLGISKFYG